MLRPLRRLTLALLTLLATHPSHAQSVVPRIDRRWQGAISVRLRNRQFFIPEHVVDGLKIQPVLSFTVAPSDALAFTLDAQTVDNSGPGLEGGFRARRSLGAEVGSGNFLQEWTLGGALRLWGPHPERLGLWLGGSVSRARRSHDLVDTLSNASVSRGNRDDLVSAFDVTVRARWPRIAAALGVVTIALPKDNALYFERRPGREDITFGTTTGIEANAALDVTDRAALWGRLFAPLGGRNSIDRTSGLPVRTLVWDGGLRYRVNGSLAAELFASNALGDGGALAALGDHEYWALGSGLVLTPSAPQLERSATLPGRRPSGLILAAPHLVPGTAELSIAGGTTGTSATLRAGLLRDLTVGVYLDWMAGVIDESELGAYGAVRLVSTGATSVGPAIAVSRSNNVFANLLTGTRDALDRLGLDKGGFRLGHENEDEGEVYLITLAVPAEHVFEAGHSLWAAPMTTVVQRKGRQLTGVAGGGTWVATPALAFTGSGGVVTSGPGNALTSEGRVRKPVWSLGMSWIGGAGATTAGSGLSLDVGLGNRVGDSPFHTLRAREGGKLALTAGLRLRVGGGGF